MVGKMQLANFETLLSGVHRWGWPQQQKTSQGTAGFGPLFHSPGSTLGPSSLDTHRSQQAGGRVAELSKVHRPAAIVRLGASASARYHARLASIDYKRTSAPRLCGRRFHGFSPQTAFEDWD